MNFPAAHGSLPALISRTWEHIPALELANNPGQLIPEDFHVCIAQRLLRSAKQVGAREFEAPWVLGEGFWGREVAASFHQACALLQRVGGKYSPHGVFSSRPFEVQTGACPNRAVRRCLFLPVLPLFWKRQVASRR